jgi:hypothetical protein
LAPLPVSGVADLTSRRRRGVSTPRPQARHVQSSCAVAAAAGPWAQPTCRPTGHARHQARGEPASRAAAPSLCGAARASAGGRSVRDRPRARGLRRSAAPRATGVTEVPRCRRAQQAATIPSITQQPSAHRQRQSRGPSRPRPKKVSWACMTARRDRLYSDQPRRSGVGRPRLIGRAVEAGVSNVDMTGSTAPRLRDQEWRSGGDRVTHSMAVMCNAGRLRSTARRDDTSRQEQS